MTRMGAILVLVLAACGEPPAPPSPDAGTGPGCVHDDDCQDGIFCNGRERCEPDDPAADGDGCIEPTRLPCPAGLDCTESEGGGCLGGCTTDADGDGALARSCGGDDCDDDDPARFPGHIEVCDEAGHDEDCDPRTVGDRDADGDGSIDAECCDRSAEPPRCGDDCDDDQPGVHRFATEACDGIDNDCDGASDEGVLIRHWPDADDDGYGDAAATPMETCSLPTGRVDRGGDCDETRHDIRPFAGELCNSVDDDCDGDVDEDAFMRCEAVAPGTVAECIAGACVVTGCAPGRFDCDQVDATGCEIDLCSDPAHCDGCGNLCPVATFTGDRYCSAGSCLPARPQFASAGTLVDDVTGAPIAGATITTVGTCRTATVTTGPTGEYELGTATWFRVEAPGYPVHVVSRSASTFQLPPMIPQSVVDAWRADPDLGLTPSPRRALVVLDYVDAGPELIHDAILGEGREAVGTDLVGPAGVGGRAVYFDAVPGRATIGGGRSEHGCAFSCTPATPVLLLPGTLTRVAGIHCSGVCS